MHTYQLDAMRRNINSFLYERSPKYTVLVLQNGNSEVSFLSSNHIKMTKVDLLSMLIDFHVSC